jgi:hypothetical protein
LNSCIQLSDIDECNCTFVSGTSAHFFFDNPPTPPHGLARNFATKIPAKKSLEKYRHAWYSLKLSRATS